MKNDFLTDDEYSLLKLKARRGTLTNVERAAYEAETKAREPVPEPVRRPARYESYDDEYGDDYDRPRKRHRHSKRTADDVADTGSKIIYWIVTIVIVIIVLRLAIGFMNKMPDVFKKLDESTEQIEKDTQRVENRDDTQPTVPWSNQTQQDTNSHGGKQTIVDLGGGVILPYLLMK